MVNKKFCLCDAIKIFEKFGFDHAESIRLATKYYVDKNKPTGGGNCISEKVKVFHDEHPEWDNDHCVAAAIGYCKDHGD